MESQQAARRNPTSPFPNLSGQFDNAATMIDPQIFEDLQTKIDEETKVRDVSPARDVHPCLPEDFSRQALLQIPVAHKFSRQS